MKRAAWVLVGGNSRRMGTDKALLALNGLPLAAVVGSIAREATGVCTLVGRPERYAHLGFPVIADLYSGEGPLGGIITALAHTEAEWNLILACDMPALQSAFLVEIFTAAENSSADVVVACSSRGIEPLCAVYHRRSLDSLKNAFDSGTRKVRDCFDGRLNIVRHDALSSLFQNTNTPEEWAQLHG